MHIRVLIGLQVNQIRQMPHVDIDILLHKVNSWVKV